MALAPVILELAEVAATLAGVSAAEQGIWDDAAMTGLTADSLAQMGEGTVVSLEGTIANAYSTIGNLSSQVTGAAQRLGQILQSQEYLTLSASDQAAAQSYATALNQSINAHYSWFVAMGNELAAWRGICDTALSYIAQVQQATVLYQQCGTALQQLGSDLQWAISAALSEMSFDPLYSWQYEWYAVQSQIQAFTSSIYALPGGAFSEFNPDMLWNALQGLYGTFSQALQAVAQEFGL